MSAARAQWQAALPSRRRALARLWASLAVMGTGGAAARTPSGGLTPGASVALRRLERVGAAESSGWLARDSAGRLWQVQEDGSTRPLGDGVAPEGPLNQQHGRTAGRGLDGRLWVHSAQVAQPQRSAALLAPHGGLCGLPLAVIGLVESAGRTVVARFEPDARGLWQVVAQSDEAVLPDAVPVITDLDGRGDGGHVAVLAGPDRQRYPHAVLGDDIEATRVLWLERHSLRPIRTLSLEEPEVFEDRQLRPWRLADGRQALVAVRSGPLGAQVAVIAAAQGQGPGQTSALQITATGPFIGTRNRWLSPASVDPAETGLYAVHTPHLGGVLHRYHPTAAGLRAERLLTGLTNHRLGARDLDISARLGNWLLLPTQDWRSLATVDLDTGTVSGTIDMGAPILQLAASAGRRSVAVLTRLGLSIYNRS